MEKKYIFHFEEAFGLGKPLLGGKGAGLAEMTHIGVPIPQGFTITTEACTLYYDSNKVLPEFLIKDIYAHIHEVEAKTGKNFGGDKNPLLVSVRSGARASMPGMMDTILNLGLNDEVVAAMIAGNPDPAFERFVYDSYRRFIQMFGDVVLASSVWNCSNGKYVSSSDADIVFGDVGFISRPSLIEMDKSLIEQFNEILESIETGCYVHVGPLASGTCIFANEKNKFFSKFKN